MVRLFWRGDFRVPQETLNSSKNIQQPYQTGASKRRRRDLGVSQVVVFSHFPKWRVNGNWVILGKSVFSPKMLNCIPVYRELGA